MHSELCQVHFVFLICHYLVAASVFLALWVCKSLFEIVSFCYFCLVNQPFH